MTERNEIAKTLSVRQSISPEEEISRRIMFLADYLRHTKATGYVLGISGGQDSALAGRLCQMAVEQLRSEGSSSTFWAIRLPHGDQLDEQDAQIAMQFISPDKRIDCDIREPVSTICTSLKELLHTEISDFNRGNVKARVRMVIQYALAAHYGALVVGTDHAAEAAVGFFTKFGDGAADVLPLYGLTKGQGKAMLRALGAPDSIALKVPTADLLDGEPCLPDEKELGLTYRDIDAFLEDRPVPWSVKQIISQKYIATLHKRQPPVTPDSTWWRSGDSRGQSAI